MYNMKETIGDLEIQTREVRGVWITEYLRNGVVETFAATTSSDRARKNHMYVVSREKKLLAASV